MTTNKITIESIVQNLNEDELAKVCKQYELEYKAKFGLLRHNLKIRMIKQLGESIHRHTFIDKFNDVLSHETKLRIFPEYDQYIERKRKKQEEEERKRAEE